MTTGRPHPPHSPRIPNRALTDPKTVAIAGTWPDIRVRDRDRPKHWDLRAVRALGRWTARSMNCAVRRAA